MPSSQKSRSKFIRLGSLAVAGGLTALGWHISRRPQETATAIARRSLLLLGVQEGMCVDKISGLPIHYYTAGTGDVPLILIHGIGGSAEVWSLLLPRLSRKYRVYALDLPGFGRTPSAPEGADLQTLVSYVRRFIDVLDYPRVSLIGNSLGGWIAARFAIDYPERVQCLYLLNSAGLRRAGEHSPYSPDRATARQTLRRLWHYPCPIPNWLVDGMVRISQQPGYVGFVQSYRPQDELEGMLDRITAPTTIIWGMQDHIFPIACAHAFHAGIAGSRLRLLPSSGHTSHIRAARTVASIILRDAQRPRQDTHATH